MSSFRMSRSWLEPASLLYLLAPNLLFALTWLRPAWAAVATLLLVGGAWNLLRHQPADATGWLPDGRALIWLLGLSLVYTALSGIGEVGFQRLDYIKHNLIYHDLVTYPWPVQYQEPDGGLTFLSYYLGYYLIPSGLGALVGGSSVNFFAFMWGWAGLFLAFTWVTRLCEGHPLPVVLMFMFFGGWDLIVNLMLEADAIWFNIRVPFSTALLVETALPVEWGLGHNYPGSMSQLAWAPQHTIVGWIAMGWILDQTLRLDRAQDIFFVQLLTLFWSPFIFLGLMPFTVWAALRVGIRPALTWHNILPSIGFGLILVLYFVPHESIMFNGWVWQYARKYGWGFSLLYYAVFEFGLYCLLLAWLHRRTGELQHRWPLLLLATGVLIGCLWYRLGLFNDFALRVTNPALTALTVLCVRAMLTWQPPRRLRMVLAGALVIGALIPLQEQGKSALYRIANPHPEWFAHPIFSHITLQHVAWFLTRESESYAKVAPDATIHDMDPNYVPGAPPTWDAMWPQYLGVTPSVFYNHLIARRDSL